MENIELGLLLMVVGMVTVFVILLIVIWLSQLLISIVNKVAPEEAPKKKVAATGASTDAGAMDAIKAAVDILTAGKGHFCKYPFCEIQPLFLCCCEIDCTEETIEK